MKYIIHIFIILLLMQSCQSKEMRINFKTIEISIPGTMGPSVKHNSKYYCYFESVDKKNSSAPFTDFYILNESGEITSKIPLPSINFTDYDLYIRNDSILTTADWSSLTFYLDEKNKKWIKTSKATDEVYKDKKYTVFVNNRGICCNKTWFQDNATGQQYEILAESPVVNKLNNVYYLTSKESVLKFNDPKSLKLMEPSDHYLPTTNTLTESEIEYSNDFSNGNNFAIMTSFVINKKLYHLYSSDNTMKIGAVKNKSLLKVQEFKSDIFPYRSTSDTRNYITDNSYKTVQFTTEDPNFFGIIEIDKNQFNVITFKNLYREPILGESKIKAWTEQNFEYFYSNLNTLSVDQVDRIEQKENALAITPEKNNDIKESSKEQRAYKKSERKYLHLLTRYDYAPENKSVEKIQFQWGFPFSTHSQDDKKNDSNELLSLNSKSIFMKKYNWLFSFLNQKLGTPVSEEPSYSKWETKTQSVELSYAKNKLILTLIKK
ncbi:hypothetical protein [Chryseobacterium sp. SIMBA_028]|uniref:hypothetical protein n=1 Tax=Chryseobacterium sp. SIMBA_028 TaxID=3085771 RepID=UPI00397D0DB6